MLKLRVSMESKSQDRTHGFAKNSVNKARAKERNSGIPNHVAWLEMRGETSWVNGSRATSMPGRPGTENEGCRMVQLFIKKKVLGK